MAVIIDEMRCTGCGVCVSLCKPGAIMLDESDSGGRAVWSAGNCVHCGLCEFYCPEQAIQMILSADSRISK